MIAIPVKVEKINISRVKRHVASLSLACIIRCISSLESHGRLEITRSGQNQRTGSDVELLYCKPLQQLAEKGSYWF